MKASIAFLGVCLVQLLLGGSVSYAYNGGATAYAIPLEGITIDGKLDDWPKDMIRYPILNHGQAYGPTDIDNADLTASSDLTPYFMVGYNPEKNLIYLAVQVRDDILSVSNTDQNSTDACEVYIDSNNSDKRVDFTSISDPNSLAAFQYVMWPPGGSYWDMNTDNPYMLRGNIKQTKILSSFNREGNISIYEWAIEAFDHYPDKPTKLIQGKTIGFDVVVVDKDETIDNPAWVCWGQFATLKFVKADTLGDLVLLNSYDDMGYITGKVTHHYNGSPWEGLMIQVKDRKGVIQSSATTDTNGLYQVWCLPGSYNVSVAVDINTDPINIDIKAGERNQNIDFSPYLGSISGKVTFVGDGSLRGGISINIEEVESIYYDMATTDSNGTYRFWLKPGHYRVSTLNTQGGGTKTINIRAGEEVININFELKEIGWDELSQNERITYLIEAIKFDNFLVRKALPRSLYDYKIDPKQAVPVLFGLLNEENPNIRAFTIDVLAKNTQIFGNSISVFVDRVIDLLKDDDPDVRISAASSLGTLGASASEAVPALIELLNDKDPNVRCAAVNVLGKIGKDAKDAIPQLIVMLENEESIVKIAVISALGDFGHESREAIPLLLKLAKKENQVVRKSAIISLGKIGDEDKEVVSLMIELLGDGYASIRMAAINAFKNIGVNAKTALPTLIFLVTFNREGSYLELIRK